VIRESAKVAVAIGLALLAFGTAAAFAVGSAPPVKHPAVHPAVGGLTTIVEVHVVADGYDAVGGPDQLEVTAPNGTRCANAAANLVVMGNVSGPHQDGSGPVTLYIGPGATEQYPALANYDAYDLSDEGTGRLLARWCPGTYTAEITQPRPVYSVVTTTFQFRISATKHVQPPPKPAIAHDLKPVTVSPSRGHRGTIFAVRYRADAASQASGDVIDVDGPKHSACKGRLVRVLSEHANWTPGPLTAHIGPGAGNSRRWGELATTASPAQDSGTGKPLRQWCPGTYSGTIFNERGPKFTVVARFALTVAR
jgi:hypothetical protein